jgi:hypothetical protein
MAELSALAGLENPVAGGRSHDRIRRLAIGSTMSNPTKAVTPVGNPFNAPSSRTPNHVAITVTHRIVT